MSSGSPLAILSRVTQGWGEVLHGSKNRAATQSESKHAPVSPGEGHQPPNWK